MKSLTIMMLLAAMMFMVAADKAKALSRQDLPANFVVFKMTSNDKNANDGSLDLVLSVRSATDMPVPNVVVVLGNCQTGQQTPFSLATRTRHLMPERESLRAFNAGRNLEWRLASAPANTAKFRQLKLKLALPANKGGPTFCVLGAATTPYDTAPAVLRRLEWRLG